MSEDMTPADDELQLEDFEGDEVTATDAETDSEEHEDESSDEQDSEDTIELEDDESQDNGEPSDAEAKREKQVKSWLKNIKEGKKKLEDLPPAQAWMKSRLEKLLDKKPKKEPVDVRKTVREVLDEERDNDRFSALKTKLEGSSLTPSQKEALKKKFTEYRAKGLSKHDALDIARQVIGVKVDINPKREGMRIRRGSDVTRKKSEYTMEEIGKLEEEVGYAEMKKRVPKDQLDKYLTAQRRGEV